MKDVLKTVRQSHFASIDTDDLPGFLDCIRRNESRMLKPTLICLRLMMLVFVRTSELIETPWSEIDLEKGEWIIPLAAYEARPDHGQSGYDQPPRLPVVAGAAASTRCMRSQAVASTCSPIYAIIRGRSAITPS
jgi:integrase